MRILFGFFVLLLFVIPAFPASSSSVPVPPGYDELCRRVPQECAADRNVTRAAPPIAYTEKLFKTLVEINYQFNRHIVRITDEDLYGVDEYWVTATNQGDCEDIVLAKRRALIALGLHPSQLLMTSVLNADNMGHLILAVRTTRGYLVMDNEDWKVRWWEEAKLTLQHRSHQIPSYPYHWSSEPFDSLPLPTLNLSAR